MSDLKEGYLIDGKGVKYYPRPSFHIGAVIISAIEINPEEEYGGVWEKFAQGRTLVGVDTSQVEFNTILKTGGEKHHTLSENEMPQHTHVQTTLSQWGYSYYPVGVNSNHPQNRLWTTGGHITGSNLSWSEKTDYASETNVTGGSYSHNNLQPYITVFYYRRIA